MKKIESARNILLPAVLVISLVVVTGCVSRHMAVLPNQKITLHPKSDEAIVVFMRPSVFGGAIQSSVFEVISNRPKFIGILSATTKMAHNIRPGKHLFMVIGENADFMEADLQKGKIYYALVTPRIGFWKARFSLRPIHRKKLKSSKFTEWFGSTEWVENTPSSIRWAKDNLNSVRSKMEEYLKKWNSRDWKPTLRPEDWQ